MPCRRFVVVGLVARFRRGSNGSWSSESHPSVTPADQGLTRSTRNNTRPYAKRTKRH